MVVTVSYDIIRPYQRLPLTITPLPVIPVRISYAGRSVDRLAIIDSGADSFAAPRSLADVLGIDITLLEPTITRGTAGPVRTWYAVCYVQVFDIQFGCPVAIIDNLEVPYLLGRRPFFQMVQLGFRESRLEMYFRLQP